MQAGMQTSQKWGVRTERKIKKEPEKKSISIIKTRLQREEEVERSVKSRTRGQAANTTVSGKSAATEETQLFCGLVEEDEGGRES